MITTARGESRVSPLTQRRIVDEIAEAALAADIAVLQRTSCFSNATVPLAMHVSRKNRVGGTRSKVAR